MDSDQNLQASAPANSGFFLPGVTYDDVLDKDILELIGVKNLTDDEKADLYNKMLMTIQDRVITRLLDFLSDEEYAVILNALEQEDRSRFEQIISEKNIDLVKIFAEETLAYKIEILNLVPRKSVGEEV
jgi:hypothetical protein